MRACVRACVFVCVCLYMYICLCVVIHIARSFLHQSEVIVLCVIIFIYQFTLITIINISLRYLYLSSVFEGSNTVSWFMLFSKLFISE